MENSILKKGITENKTSKQTKNIIEVSKGHFVTIVEVYGDKPMGEVFEEFSPEGANSETSSNTCLHKLAKSP